MASELPGASPSDHTGRSHVPHGVPDLERHGHQGSSIESGTGRG